MAKRKRLTPPQDGFLHPDPQAAPLRGPLGGGMNAPISAVAGEASARAALEEVSAEMSRARAEGRMVETLPVGAIDPQYLMRDRMVQDDDDMAALRDSLRARGQQTPIEVVALPAPANGRTHGLVSGWRRLSALQALHREDPAAGFGTVRALVVAPESQQAAYVAMVEENEIRADLSLYERAHIAFKAHREGIYPTLKTALQGLFGSVSRSKRSKINSFVPLVDHLDGALKFPTAISEKLGLELSRRVQEDTGFADALAARLRIARPADAPAELAMLNEVLKAAPKGAKPQKSPAATPPAPASAPAPAPGAGSAATPGDVRLRFDPGAQRVVLTGPGVDKALAEALGDWLRQRR